MAAFIMASRLHAIGFILLLSAISIALPPLGLLSSAAVALVTLRLGLQQGLQVAIPASVGLGLLTFAINGSFAMGLLSAWAEWLPLILLAYQLNRTVSWQKTLETAMLIVLGLLLVFHVLVGDTTAFWEKAIDQILASGVLGDNPALSTIRERVEDIAMYLTGAVAALLSVHLVVSLLLARHWQAQLYNPEGFQKELHNLRLSQWAALGMFAAVTATLFTSSALALDVTLVGLAYFLFAGISLVHSVVHIRQLHISILIAMYVFLFFATVPVAILLATFGIIDSQANFRSYLQKTQDS